MKIRVISAFAVLLLAVLICVPCASAQSSSQEPAAQQPTVTAQPQASDSAAPAQVPDENAGAAAPSDEQKTPAAKSSTSDKEKMKADKSKHDGSKNDIDAIGNRKVGGSKLGNWYSLEKEMAMGKQFATEVESTAKLIQDPVVTEYVNRIGQNLVRNSDARVPFTIKVIDSDEVNAFALPGGFFYVNSGLILATDEEAELAGVMAHEIAHVAARHGMREMTRANWMNYATIPLIFVGGGIGYATYQAAGLGIPLTFAKFRRGFEAEADYLGIQYMYKTGYDPQAFVSAFEKLVALEKKKPGALSKAFASHPPTEDRITNSQQEIAHVLTARDQYVVSTSEFEEVKARLAAIENRRKFKDNTEKDRPSLRRANTGNNTDSGKSPDDDRPTLKKRDND